MTLPIMVKDLSFRYQGSKKEILTGINITVNQGEILAIVGLSGSGKSTLCYCISGIIPHIYQGELSGEVLLKGSSTRSLSLPRIATQLGIVFQNPETQLFFPIVEDEIAFGPENLCLAREEIGQRLAQVLELTGMERQRYSNPQLLSGGQKQLIALSSVLSLQPDILVFDEVMAQLDPAGKELIKNMILNLKEQGKTVIMIDHDCDNLVIADKVKILKQGRLLDFDGTFS
ncbi:MAG: energy-coupling factor ABC transporter ATP-binding protein [Halanaerobiales bacterium]|nr:energy-coupling factor ABC transporter ATP-binding protein [Halanaerobiales bacterium]